MTRMRPVFYEEIDRAHLLYRFTYNGLLSVSLAGAALLLSGTRVERSFTTGT